MLFGFLGVILCQVLLFLLAVYLIKRLISSLMANVRLYFECKQEGKQSEFADLIDNIGARFATAITASIKGSLMGSKSAEARQASAINAELITGALPMGAQLLLGQFPKLKRMIGKNPELAEMALKYLNRQPSESEGNGNKQVTLADPFKL